jgi:hypothetical protein
MEHMRGMLAARRWAPGNYLAAIAGFAVLATQAVAQTKTGALRSGVLATPWARYLEAAKMAAKKYATIAGSAEANADAEEA